MREYELEPEARLRTRQVSRSVVDDISTWWNGEPNFKVEKVQPEKPFTKQDFDQTMSLVYMPVNLAHLDVFGKRPDPDTCKAAAGRLGPAISALQVIAGSKREDKNKQNILLPLPDIQSAQTSLQVMGDPKNASSIWKGAFGIALDTLETVIALPVIDEKSADPPPANGVTERDHDLLVASVRPTLQRLVQTTSTTPYSSWDPRNYSEGNEALAALGSVSHPHLRPAVDAVKRGMDAITTFAKNLEDQAAEAAGKLESAMQKLSQQQASYVDEVAAQQDEPK
jgi:hypothetical protein